MLFHDAYDTIRRASTLIDTPGTPTGPVQAKRLPLDAANIAREQLEAELAAMRASASWRLTAPLRRFKALLRRGP